MPKNIFPLSLMNQMCYEKRRCMSFSIMQYRSLNVTVPVLNSRGRCSMVVYLSTRTEWRSAERGYSPYVKNHSKPPSLTHGDSDDGKMDRSVSISKMYASVWSYKCLGYRKTKRTYVELCLFTLHT